MRSCKHFFLLWKSNKHYILCVCVCVCVALVIRSYKSQLFYAVIHRLLWPVQLHNIFFTWSHKLHDFKKVTESKMCIFIFSTDFVNTDTVFLSSRYVPCFIYTRKAAFLIKFSWFNSLHWGKRHSIVSNRPQQFPNFYKFNLFVSQQTTWTNLAHTSLKFINH
jgi:hypothetical protein